MSVHSQTYRFAEVILPLAAPGSFTYQIGEMHSGVMVGCRVLVEFGARKLYAGIVFQLHNNPPKYDTKTILEVMDETPVVNEHSLSLWQWMSQYYMCSIGEVCEAALPAMLKIHSETRVYAVVEQWPEELLNPELQRAFFLIHSAGELSLSEMQQEFPGARAMRVVRALTEMKLVSIQESVNQQFKPKVLRMIALNENIEESFEDVLAKLNRSPVQKMVFEAFLKHREPVVRKIARKHLNASDAAIKGLVDKGYLVEIDRVVNRFDEFQHKVEPLPMLTPAQQKACDEIEAVWQSKKAALLYGVTSSGKTELYFHLIKKYIERGEQVLVLLPEIALTGQLVHRFRIVFGDRVGVYHSRIGAMQRVEIWKDVAANGKFKIIVGPRSALFLPFVKLGCIVVDEEHDRSYKQHDPAPRYNARDAAIVVGELHKANVLLGTATPSLESLANHKSGRYGLVRLTERYGNYVKPNIEIVDYAKWWRRHKVQAHLTPVLLDAIKESVASGNQVILFQNRRGFAPYVQCTDCGEIPYCPHCDVRLTWHKYHNRLVCHYCGYSKTNTERCSACGSVAVKTMGFGTEKIETELQKLLPDVVVGRFDQDTTRGKNGHDEIIARFEAREIDILVGTQMVTKGIDFKNVNLVGVLNADNLFSFPDFRSFERSMQMLTQVAGRAGRHGHDGKVIIQTSQPEHVVISSFKQSNFGAFTERELKERFQFGYPPFFRLISLTVKHKKPEVCTRAANLLAANCRKIDGAQVLGPQAPVISRIQQYYIQEMMIKMERSPRTLNIKQKIVEQIELIKQTDGLKSVIVVADVDPY